MGGVAVRQGLLQSQFPHTRALTGALSAEGGHWLQGEGQEGVRERGRGVSTAGRTILTFAWKHGICYNELTRSSLVCRGVEQLFSPFIFRPIIN